MIHGVRKISAAQRFDERGIFYELASSELMPINQVNVSVSRTGTTRGIHFSHQAKYVSCLSGMVIDHWIDLRVGSPTFGEKDKIFLTPEMGTSVYLPAGIGHAFQAFKDSTVMYLCSETYDPEREFGITPHCRTAGLDLAPMVPELISEKDRNALTLPQAMEKGLLPVYEPV